MTSIIQPHPRYLALRISVFPLLSATALVLALLVLLSNREPCRGGPMPLVPRVSWAPFVPESPSDSDIRITADGMIFLESKWFPDSESTAMFQRVAARSLSHAGSRVLLRVDRNVPFGTVRHFLERLRDIGITDATLLVRR